MRNALRKRGETCKSLISNISKFIVFIYLLIYSFIYLFTYLFIYLFIYIFMYYFLFIYLFIYFLHCIRKDFDCKILTTRFFPL